MTTTTTSGAADLRATFSEMLVDLPNTEPFTLFKAGFDAALAAGQATAAPVQPAPATQQAGATKEHVRLLRAIADKIEDGTLFRSGIYSNKDLARFVRNVADAAAPQFPTTQAQADSVLEDAARYRFLRDGEWRDTDLEPFIRLQLNTLWDAKIDAARAAQEGKSHE